MALKDYLSKQGSYTTPDYKADIELYVPADAGNDALLEAWKEVARLRREQPGKSITIRVGAGEFRNINLHITSEMSGRKDAPVTMVSEHGANGERAVLSGGITLLPSDFKPVPDDIRERLHDSARDNVVCVDLKKYGLTAADWGEIHAVGAYETSRFYDGVTPGVTAEVFFNGKRMHMAQYPNRGQYLRLDNVADVGDCAEFPPQCYFRDFYSKRNQRGGCYVMRKEDNERVRTWKSHDNIWAYGYFFWDWADSSTPVTFDTEHRRFYPKFVSMYGARAGALYYFYNVLDELDEPGEYYLDRTTGILYIYPLGDLVTAKIEMSLSTKPVITIDGATDITIEGFSVCNVRGNGITAKGDRLKIRDCSVYNTAGGGIDIAGQENLVEHCEISHTGRFGISMTGGDRKTLTPGNCMVLNNNIHHFAEIYQTYAGGIHLNGVGNTAAHNEVAFTPHAAIFYSGNDHIIEYNYIHDAVLHSDDAGAIYSGQDWTQRGTVIRYNVLERIGSDEFKPCGIYWDDGLSGQTAYGNLLIHIGHNGFLIGGGAHCVVKNNLIIDASTPISYDSRNRDGVVSKGWCHQHVDTKEGRAWKLLYSMPIHSAVWEEHYPVFKTIRDDLENKEAWDDPNFPTNPAYSVISGNIILTDKPNPNYFAESVFDYSTVENNPIFTSKDDPGFINAENGDYRLTETSEIKKLVPDFTEIPFDKIGRF